MGSVISKEMNFAMIKRNILISFFTVLTFLSLGSLTVKADQATAATMQPVLRAMYHVDEAEAILRDKKAALAACRKANAPALQMAAARAAVNDASNLLNALNAMIASDTIIINAAPPGVVNPPSFAVNSLTAQGAWHDFWVREAAGHVMIFPAAAVPSAAEMETAIQPFCMY